MNRRSLWKIVLSLGLCILLISPTASLAKGRDDKPYIPESLIKNEAKIAIEYTKGLTQYAKDCESLKKRSASFGSTIEKMSDNR